MLLGEYTITETLQETEGAGLYRATRNSDQRRVLLKRPLGSDAPQPSDLARFRHECSVVQGLDLPTVLKVEAFVASSNRPVLVLENFGGVSLDRCLGRPMPVEEFLPRTIRMARALATIHGRGITHRNLTPRSFLVELATTEVKLTGFGLASHLTSEQPSASDPHLLDGALPYMSPEQTGRMNRVVDFRSDLYSLGVIFYEMLTGSQPFQARDPLEWVHCHVARQQQDPSDRVPGIPGPLSEIVAKLMAKMADDRYQSATGLEADLDACLSQWRARGRIEPFALGTRDVSERFVVPQRLYGRQREVAALVSAFEGVSQTGTPATVLISGYSGIGKTTLVQELYRPIVRARGYFISGKFDQFKGSIPYAIITQAFGGLMRQLLGESDERVARWRSRFQAALGINGQLIVDVVPELALIIGSQPPVPEIGLAEAESRFHLVFRQFLGVITQAEHPVALFLDDLQWMDSASMKLVEHLATHPDTRHLLLIGAYRSNEVGPHHPLRRTLAEMGRSGAVENLELGPLSFADQRQLIADSTHARPAEADRLARLVSRKTGGNPFFVIQFLIALVKDELMVFDRPAGAWRWRLKAIEARGFTDNVVDLMVSRIGRLPRAAAEAMRTAAVAGDRVDVGTLALVSGRTEEETHHALGPAVREGLLARQDRTYTFVHDRIQQAAYSLLDEGQRAALHLRIGRLLLSSTPPEGIPERVFDIVDQLNRGAALVVAEDEKIRIARLDLVAAHRARASSAHLSAVVYASAGLALLSKDARRSQHELAFALDLECASCDYLTGRFDEAEARLADLVRRARTRTERAAATVVNMNLHTNQVRPDLAVAAAIDCLRDFGVALVPHPTRERTRRAFVETLQGLEGRQIEELLDLPRLTDPDVRAAMDVLTALFAPALQTDQHLLCLVACQAVTLSIRHGNTDATSIAYVYFGLVLGPLFGRHREAHRFGRLGYDLVERRGLVSNRALVLTCFEGGIRPWTEPIRDSLPGLERAFDAAMEAGNVTFACYAQHHLAAGRIIAGDPLDEAYRASQTALAFVRGAQFGLVDMVITAQQRFIQNMRGLTESFSSFDDDSFRQGEFEERLLANVATMSLPACLYFVWKTQARFLSGDNDEAARAAAQAEALLWSVPSFQEIPDHYYYSTLVLAARYESAPADERRSSLIKMRAHERQFRVWADSCPANFAHKHRLISAEIARVSGRPQEAMELFEQAIKLARENGFVQNEAIGYELASRFFRQRGFEVMADTYLREARSGYARWGAEGKVRQLDLRYPQLRARGEPGGAPATANEQLDVISVAKVSQAISREVVLPDLIKTMLRLLVEQAGAQKGSFLLARGGRFRLAAATEEGTTAVKLQPGLPVTNETPLPLSILNYVLRTGEAVSLEDAARRGRYVEDPYVVRHRPKSVLCLPLIRQASPLGILYLENNLTTHAFAADRLLVLQLLAAQAAIALENAQLYLDLQTQQAATRASQEQLQAIVDSSAAVIFLKDTQGRYLLVNRRYEEIFHLTRDAVLGKTDYDILDKESADAVRANDRTVLRAETPMELEETIPHDGSLHTYISLKFPVRGASGAPYGVCGVATDITSRKHGEDSLRQAVRMRDEFLSVASHELRTPLASLMLSLEIIRRASKAEPRLEKAVAAAWQGGERLQRLFEELLDVSRIDAEHMTLERADVDLDGLARKVVARFKPDIERARCQVVVYGRSLWGSWDRSRLDQVVANLLANALKFGRGLPVEISTTEDGPNAILSVRDYGIGIDPAHQDVVFDRFQRAVSERHYGGLGLGLYICRRIVEAHGGSIRVQSEPGVGATFTVELPRAAHESAEQRQASGAPG
jgi:PAS domain S-box-containing protein